MTSLRLRVGRRHDGRVRADVEPQGAPITRPPCSTTPACVELKGVVKELQWTNPHVWLQVTVDDKGAKKEWSVEAGQPEHAVAHRLAQHVVQAW